MPRFNFSKLVSKHSLEDLGDFTDVRPKVDSERGQTSSITAQSENAEDTFTTTSRSEITSMDDGMGPVVMSLDDNTEITVESYAGNPDLLRAPTVLYGNKSRQPKTIGRPLSESGFKSFNSFDIDRSTLENSEESSVSENLTVRSTKILSPNFFQECTVNQQKPEKCQEMDEMNSTAKSRNSDTTVNTSELPSDDDRNTFLGKGLVMVLDEFNTLRRIKQQEELLKYLRTKPGATPQNPGAIKALDHLQNKEVEKIQHFSDLGEYMKILQSKKQVCDVEIRIGNDSFLVHSIALSCFSSYFSDLFSKRSGKYQVPMTIRISGISSEVFRVFLDFVYKREFNINPDILTEVINMAETLCIPALKEHCLELLDNTSLEKAIQSLRGKRHPRSTQQFAFIVARIAEEFLQVLHCERFFELDVDTVCLVFSNDDLQISTEMDVFRIALKWLAHSMHERRQYISKVMECIRFPYMTQAELFDCFEMTDLLNNCPETRKIIWRANWIITAKMLEREDHINVPILAARTCFTESQQQLKKKSLVFFSAHSLQVHVEPSCSPIESNSKDQGQNKETAVQKNGDILAIGGYRQYKNYLENTKVKLVQNYNSLTNQWSHYTDLPEPRFHHAAAVLNGKMYLTGGSYMINKIKVLTNDAFVFNYQTKQWTQIESMNTPRMDHAICSLQGMLYVIGGEGEKSSVLSSVECYNPITNAWFFVKSMLTPRLGASAAALDGKIIVVGGSSETATTDDSVLRSVESYDPRLNSWKPKNHLRFPRCHANIVNVQGDLYLCGGAISSSFGTNTPVLTSVSSIDVYDKHWDIWEQITNLNIARHYAGCAVIGERIFMIGGVSTQTGKTLQSVECYDVSNDEWISGIKNVPYPARWMSCVTFPAEL